MKPLRVILDTNLWVSYLITKTFIDLDDLVINHQIKFLFSPESISEFIEVADRPKFKKHFSQRDVFNLLVYMDKFGEMVDVSAKVEICRDKKDNFWLSLAWDGKADYLVTGDNDLLVLKSFRGTEILTFQEFLMEVQSS